MKVSFNRHGLLGMAAIALMVGIAFARRWQIPWLYFGAAVLFYAGAVIALSVWQDEERNRQANLRAELSSPMFRDHHTINMELSESQAAAFTFFRVLLGCHLTFSFQALGLLIDTESVVVRLGYFLASAAIGLVIPFLLLSKGADAPLPSSQHDSPDSEPHR
jgi:hypothetical protein